jgi:hypothetical protein
VRFCGASRGEIPVIPNPANFFLSSSSRFDTKLLRFGLLLCRSHGNQSIGFGFFPARDLPSGEFRTLSRLNRCDLGRDKAIRSNGELKFRFELFFALVRVTVNKNGIRFQSPVRLEKLLNVNAIRIWWEQKKSFSETLSHKVTKDSLGLGNKSKALSDLYGCHLSIRPFVKAQKSE